MKIDIEIPNSYAELLKDEAILERRDPATYIKEYVEYWTIDSFKANETYRLVNPSIVEARIHVPKPIMDFLKDLGADFKTFLEENVVDWFGSWLEVSYEDPGVFGCPRFLDVRPLIEKHCLNEISGLEVHIRRVERNAF